MNKLAGSLLLFLAVTGSALALTAPVPEIDGSSFVTGIALVAGAFLVIRARDRR